MVTQEGFGAPTYWAAAATFTGVVALSLLLTRTPSLTPRTILLSPRTTLLPHLSPGQSKSLGYPPDALPGARDVSTPYGSMRAYEWGPLDGRRVLMVHGDATPSPMFGRIAKILTAQGCRVLTFDLWGRGYSDTPSGNQHNSPLYMQQILYAVISSPVQWTGVTRFSMIGFSMGGAITLDFFAHQPSLVESIILLGPAGLIRTLPDEYRSFYFKYQGLTTTSNMRKLIGTLLGVDLTKSPTKTTDIKESSKPEGFTPAGALQFQFDHHPGHVESFLSTINYGPLQNQEEIWSKACKIIAGESKADTPLCGGRILVICGSDDSVVPPKDVKMDLGTYLGREGDHWVFDTVPGGHGFPWPEGESIGVKIADFWDLRRIDMT